MHRPHFGVHSTWATPLVPVTFVCRPYVCCCKNHSSSAACRKSLIEGGVFRLSQDCSPLFGVPSLGIRCGIVELLSCCFIGALCCSWQVHTCHLAFTCCSWARTASLSGCSTVCPLQCKWSCAYFDGQQARTFTRGSVAWVRHIALLDSCHSCGFFHDLSNTVMLVLWIRSGNCYCFRSSPSVAHLPGPVFPWALGKHHGNGFWWWICPQPSI